MYGHYGFLLCQLFLLVRGENVDEIVEKLNKFVSATDKVSDDVKKDYQIIFKNKNNIFFNPIKKYIGLILKQKQNEPYFSYKEANNIFFKIFKEKLPALSDFYTNDFFNS